MARKLRFSWGFFRDLIDWSSDTVAAYGAPQIFPDFLKFASDAGVTVDPAITAHSGGGQGSAYQLVDDFSNVTTAAAVGDSVKLPAALAGLTFTVANSATNSIDVFPATGDRINGASVNTALAVPAGSTLQFVAINTTDWKAIITKQTTSLITKRTAIAVNTTGSVTAAELAGGLITSTSAAAVAVTLPTATLLAAQIGAARGTTFDFVTDNSAGANTVTIVVNTGITVATPAITGGDTLTVSTANVIGYFRLTFTSATAAVLSRIV